MARLYEFWEVIKEDPRWHKNPGVSTILEILRDHGVRLSRSRVYQILKETPLPPPDYDEFVKIVDATTNHAVSTPKARGSSKWLVPIHRRLRLSFPWMEENSLRAFLESMYHIPRELPPRKVPVMLRYRALLKHLWEGFRSGKTIHQMAQELGISPVAVNDAMTFFGLNKRKLMALSPEKIDTLSPKPKERRKVRSDWVKLWIRIPPDIAEKLEELAMKKGESRNMAINELLKIALEEIEHVGVVK